jgi:hypothetical protein
MNRRKTIIRKVQKQQSTGGRDGLWQAQAHFTTKPKIFHTRHITKRKKKFQSISERDSSEAMRLRGVLHLVTRV